MATRPVTLGGGLARRHQVQPVTTASSPADAAQPLREDPAGIVPNVRTRYIGQAVARECRHRCVESNLRQRAQPGMEREDEPVEERCHEGGRLEHEHEHEALSAAGRCAHCDLPLQKAWTEVVAQNGEQYCCVGCLTLEARLRDQKREIRRLQGLVERDAVTGAASKLQLGLLWERVLVYGNPALLFLDIDHFKEINDLWGHPVGDQVLAGIVLRVCAALRPQDACIRYGGDEFVVLLANVDLQQAEMVGERIRQTVASDPIAGPTGAVSVTVSIGVAALPNTSNGEQCLARWLSAADEALYQAKANGRNRVMLARDPREVGIARKHPGAGGGSCPPSLRSGDVK